MKKIAICCAMNQNRSMEAHSLLVKNGIMCQSFGTSELIKIPGEAMNKPNTYEFGIKYNEIYNDLISKNEKFYRECGLLHLLERNMSIKESPENIFNYVDQKVGGDLASAFDLIITCEDRCFKSVFDYLTKNNINEGECKNGNNLETFRGCWIVNFNIEDTPSIAVFGANKILAFVQNIFRIMSQSNVCFSSAVESAINEYSTENDEEILFTVI